MFFISIKASKRQLITLLICLAVLITVVVVSVFRPMGAAQTAAKLADDAARMAHLRSLGYEVEAGAEVEEMLLPAAWDHALTDYNRLQQAAGYDLTPYLGKRIKCWSYTVTNLPEPATAHLYTFDDVLIAGDVTTQDGTQMKALVPINGKEETYATATG